MRLSRGGCPGNRCSVVHFLCRFLVQGQCAWKWAAVEKIGFYRTHYSRKYSPEWIAVDSCAYPHSEFNLSTLKAYLRKPSIANLLWPRAGLLRMPGRHIVSMSQMQCKILVAFNFWPFNHWFLNPAFKRSSSIRLLTSICVKHSKHIFQI